MKLTLLSLAFNSNYGLSTGFVQERKLLNTFFLFIFLFSTCAKEHLPSKKYHQYTTANNFLLVGKVLSVELNNPLNPPGYGQAIGISGMTGFTDVAHLPFALLEPVNNQDGIRSVPVTFVEGYRGKALKKNDIVSKKN